MIKVFKWGSDCGCIIIQKGNLYLSPCSFLTLEYYSEFLIFRTREENDHKNNENNRLFLNSLCLICGIHLNLDESDGLKIHFKWIWKWTQ